MLKIDEILSYYQTNLHKFEQFIFKEYLQYLILKIVFESKFANKLSFLGGTCLRIVYNNNRFSEDLDFDNFGLTIAEFDNLSSIIKKELEKLGFTIEIKNIFKGAFRCSIKIPKILKEMGYSNIEKEKILIQIDTAAHNFDYEHETKVLNQFGLVFPINTTPLSIIASQKIYAIFNRKRPKGRDFYDLVFILGKTGINMEYIQIKLGFQTQDKLKQKLLNLCDKMNFEYLIKDTEAFLFERSGINNIKYFKNIIQDSL